MSSNCLRTPNGFCQRGIPLEHLFFPLSFIYFFPPPLLSGVSTLAVEVMLNMRALPRALNSLSGNGLFCFAVKTTQHFPGRVEQKTMLIVSGRKKKKNQKDKNRRRKTVLLNALSYPRRSRRRQDRADKSSAGGMFIMCR